MQGRETESFEGLLGDNREEAEPDAEDDAPPPATPRPQGEEVAPAWQLDVDVTQCPGRDCGKRFHPLTLRKHHCRGCGAVFCAGCSRHLLQLSPLAAATLAAGRPPAEPVRTCEDCFARLSSVEHARPYDVQ